MGRIESSGVRGGGLALAGLLSLASFGSGCGAPASAASDAGLEVPPPAEAAEVPGAGGSGDTPTGGEPGGFGDDGQLTYGVDAGRAWDLARTPDDGFVIAGAGTREGRSTILVLKFGPDGRFDDAFGSGGQAWIDAGGIGSDAGRVEVDGEGRIVVGGAVELHGGGRALLVARLSPDGVLDGGFGVDGLALHDATPADDRVFALALDESDAVHAGGTCGGVACVTRFTSEGALDRDFAAGGTARMATGAAGAVLDLIRDAAGRLVAGGVADGHTLLSRLLAAGSLDSTFAHGGTRIGDWGEVHAVAEQADGRVLTAGSDFLVRRFHADGTLDTGFADEGVAHAGGSLGRARDLVALPGGETLVFGWGDPGDEAPHSDFIATRLDADGWFDGESFGGTGRLTVDFDGGMDVGLAMAPGPDGAILFGTTTNAEGEALALARISL